MNILSSSPDSNRNASLVAIESTAKLPFVLTGQALTNANPLNVSIVDGSGTQITSFGGGTQYADGATQVTPTGTVALGKDGSNVLHALPLDASNSNALKVSIVAGAGSGGTASTYGAAFPSTGTAIGASDGTNMQNLLVESASQKNLRIGIYNGGTEAAVKAASTAAGATDPALVVAVSPNNSIAVTGTFWQSTQPVSLTSLPALVAGTALIGKVGIDQTTPGTTNAVAIAQIGSTTILSGNGATGSGSQRVTLASDNTAIANWGQGATAAAVPANAVYGGRIAKTALPTAVSDAQLVGAMSDKFGRQVALLGTIRDLVGTQTTTISASTTETTIVTAAASVFNDLMLLVISNTSASTNTRIDFRDTTAGSVLFSLQSIGGANPIGFSLGGASIPQTSVNTNWTAQCATSTTDVRVYAVFAKNK